MDETQPETVVPWLNDPSRDAPKDESTGGQRTTYRCLNDNGSVASVSDFYGNRISPMEAKRVPWWSKWFS